MQYYSLFLGIVWLVFVTYWLISALGAKRNVYLNYNGLLVRIAIVFVILILFLHMQLFPEISYPSFPFLSVRLANPIIRITGDILAVIGVAFAIWARVYLGRNWGMPMSVKENPELVTSGPYRYVRHPIYSGMLLTMIGSVLVEGLVWIIPLILFGIYFLYAANREEKLKLQEFPDQYSLYKKKSKMLIPFIF